MDAEMEFSIDVSSFALFFCAAHATGGLTRSKCCSGKQQVHALGLPADNKRWLKRIRPELSPGLCA